MLPPPVPIPFSVLTFLRQRLVYSCLKILIHTDFVSKRTREMAGDCSGNFIANNAQAALYRVHLEIDHLH